jgi:hypothetical protein
MVCVGRTIRPQVLRSGRCAAYHHMELRARSVPAPSTHPRRGCGLRRAGNSVRKRIHRRSGGDRPKIRAPLPLFARVGSCSGSAPIAEVEAGNRHGAIRA